MEMNNTLNYYVSPKGNDNWSGKLQESDISGSDGPFKTLDGARKALRKIKTQNQEAGNVVVRVREGIYRITEPVVFDHEDCCNVTYSAYPGEYPVIDGGVEISGWEKENINGIDMWVCDVSEIIKKHGDFKQLFVNGERRNRPRLPKQGYYWIKDVPGTSLEADVWSILGHGSDSFVFSEGDMKNWKNIRDVDAVVLHFWVSERMLLERVDEASQTVKSSRRSAFVLRDDVEGRFAKYYLENVFEALSEPGEWYLDKEAGKVYYIPFKEEKLEDLQVTAPVAYQLVRLEGNPTDNKLVDSINFRGLTFRHTNWIQPLDGRASAGQAESNIPGVIYMKGARNCTVEDCTIEHVGWYGIELDEGCKSNSITGNTIRDMGAGGIKINGAATPENKELLTGDNSITDNHIYNGGNVFLAGIGVFLRHTYGNKVLHNHIHDFFYTGISCGYVWGYMENATRDNRIEKNHIHDLGKGILSDMGGIYLLGMQPGTTIRGNLIHDVEKCNYGGWGIYTDEGSSYLVIEDNICYNTSSQPFHQHFGKENTIRNNIFAFGREGTIAISRGNRLNWPQKGALPDGSVTCAFTFERNIVVSDSQPVFVGGLGDQSGNLEEKTFISDLNILWDISGSEPLSGNAVHGKSGFDMLTHRFDKARWMEIGYDQHSVWSDPGFTDLSARDFGLKADSPAYSIGFKPIDMKDIGPRKKTGAFK